MFRTVKQFEKYEKNCSKSFKNIIKRAYKMYLSRRIKLNYQPAMRKVKTT